MRNSESLNEISRGGKEKKEGKMDSGLTRLSRILSDNSISAFSKVFLCRIYFKKTHPKVLHIFPFAKTVVMKYPRCIFSFFSRFFQSEIRKMAIK